MSRLLKTKDAINEAIAQEMRRDEKVFIMGEDIAGGATNKGFENKSGLGGAYGVTMGLVEEFGRKRVIDTPISETAFLGSAIGAAYAGLRPIVEIMYVDFIGVCYDQLYNQAAKLFYLYGGKTPIPLVLRMPVGAGYGAGAEHSQILYSMFASIPGLKVVTPSNAYDAKGLLIQAIRDNDPVVFLEHKKTYMQECDVPEEEYTIPFGKACIKKEGTDVTIIAVHRMVEFSMEAAERLEEEGISAEVIDPRTISPLDIDSFIKSANKTGRVVVCDEGYPRCGLSSDIASQISQRAFSSLKAPVKTVNPPHTHIPYVPSLENEWIPSAEKIYQAVKDIF